MSVPFLRQNQGLDQVLSQEVRVGPVFLDQMGERGQISSPPAPLGMGRKLVSLNIPNPYECGS